MNKRLPLFMTLVFIAMSNNLIGQLNPCAPIGEDWCVDAPLINSCQINGWRSDTDPDDRTFTRGDVPNRGWCIDPVTGFEYTIENNQWLSFIADDDHLHIEVDISECDANRGIQLGAYEYRTLDGDCPGEQVSCIGSLSGENTSFIFYVEPLIPGDQYLIMIDGYGGDGCPFTLWIDSGVDIYITASVESFPLCEGYTSYGVLSAEGSDIGSNTIYGWETENGSIVAGHYTLTPVIDAPGDYTFTIYDLVTCCWAQETVTVEMATLDDEPAAVASVDGPIGCNGNSVTLSAEGSVLDSGQGSIPDYLYGWLDEDGNQIHTGFEFPGVTEPGTYTLVVFDWRTGCSGLAPVEVVFDTIPPEMDPIALGLLDCNVQEISIVSNPDSTITSFSWEGPDGFVSEDSNFVASLPGAYEVTVTAINGCTNVFDVNVDADLTEPDLSAMGGLLDCNNQSIAISANSADDIVAYEWTGPNGFVSNEQNPMINVDGEYIVSATGTNGCVSTFEIEVTADFSEPSIETSVDDVLDCNTLELMLNGTSEDDVTFSWSGPNGFSSNESSPMVDEIGEYTLTVLGQNGCVSTSSVEVMEDLTLPNIAIENNDVLSCDLLELTLIGSSIDDGVTYEWSGVNGFAANDASTSVTEPGVYTLIITGLNGCTNIETVEVTQNIEAPLVNAGPDGLITCTDSDAVLDGSASQTGPNIIYTWIGAGGNELGDQININVNNPGTYSLLVTDLSNGCTAIDEVEIMADESVPIADAGPELFITCNNSTVNLNGSNSSAGGSISYQWIDENGNLIGTDINQTVSDDGVYTLIVSDASNGCVTEAQVQVTEDVTDPEINIEPTQELNCNNLESSLDGSASIGGDELMFNWLDSNGNSVSTNASTQVSSSGTYTLQVVNPENGCVSTEEIVVTENFVEPIANPGTPFTITCTESMGTLDGSLSTGENLSYSWQNANGQEIGTEETLLIDLAGNYSLVVTNQDNGCTNIAEISIAEDTDFPIVNPVVDAVLTCTNQSVNLDGSASSTGANFVYEWINDSGQTVSNDLMGSVSNPGLYTLIVTNVNNSCSSEMEIEVLQDIEQPLVDPGIPQTITCDVSEVSLNGNGSSTGANISYDWQNSNGLSIGDQLQLIVSNPDMYTLIVTNNSNGCTNAASVEVVPDENIPLSFVQVDDELDCLTGNVNLSSDGSTQGSNIIRQWLGPDGNIIDDAEFLSVDEPGVYTLQLLDENNGCSSEASIEVIQNIMSPEITIEEPIELNCQNLVVDLGVVVSMNANGIMEYEWISPGGNSIGNNFGVETSEAGMYTVIVTDPSNGCTTEAQVLVEQDVDLPIADPGTPTILTCENNTTFLGGTNTSSGTEIIYEWTDANGDLISNEAEIEVSSAGEYSLLVINTNNFCESISSVLVEQDADFPNADAGSAVTLNCEITNLTIGSLNSDQGNNIRYEWYNEDNQLVGEELELNIENAGAYELIVFNTENGCSAISSVNVDEDIAPPIAIIGEPDLLTCTVPLIPLSSFGSSTGANITFEWSDEDGQMISSQEITEVSNPGIYHLLITDLTNGCTSTTFVEVNADENTPVSDAGASQNLTCDVTSINLDGTGSTGGSVLEYEWRNESGDVLSTDLLHEVTEPGVYTLYLLDPTNGCEDESKVTITQDIVLPEAVVQDVGDLTCYDPVQQISALGSSEGNNYTYQWLNEIGNVVSNEFNFETDEPGMYSLIVTNNENGCSAISSVNLDENQLLPNAVAEIIGPQTINCFTSTILLDGTSSIPFANLKFAWFDEEGNFISDADQIEVSESGDYTLIITDLENGCIEEASIIVDKDVDAPIVVIDPPEVINCYQPSILLDALQSSQGTNFEYIWSTSNGGEIKDGEMDIPTPEINLGGTYTLTIINTDNGCELSESVEVMVDLEPPIVETMVDDELDCITPEVSLNGIGSSTGSNFTYEWMGSGILNGATGLQPSVNEAGLYELLVTNLENGCTSLKGIEVFRNEAEPTDAIIDLADITCFGFDDGYIEIASVIGGTEPYLFSFEGSDFSDEIIFDNLGPGIYPLQVIDATGCEWETTLSIIEPEQVYVDLGPDLEIELGDVVDLYANSNGTNIVWETEDSLDCYDNCFTQQVSPFETTTYFVEVWDENGCPDIDEVLLRVDRTRAVYIPNVFSPNGDGINDFFTVYKNKTIKKINKMLIADRWGEIIFVAENFEPEDPANGWTGELREQELNGGVFVYYAEVEFIDGFVGKYKGDVTLMR